MTCPSKLCPRDDRDGCDLLVCAFDLPALRRFQLVGGFLALGAPQMPAPMRPPSRSQEYARLYAEGRTLREVADMVGVTHQCVQQAVARHGVDARTAYAARVAAKHEAAEFAELLRRIRKGRRCEVCEGIVIRKSKRATCSPSCDEVWLTFAPRFWALVDTSAGPDACWPWTGRVNSVTGYGNVTWGDQGQAFSHRVAYTLAKGPIPDGLTIDHVYAAGCRMRHCANPAHLEAVTSRENILRSPVAPAAINARKTHCPDGHEYAAGPATCRNCVGTRRRRAESGRESYPCSAVNLRTSKPCKRSAREPGGTCHIHSTGWVDTLRAAKRVAA